MAATTLDTHGSASATNTHPHHIIWWTETAHAYCHDCTASDKCVQLLARRPHIKHFSFYVSRFSLMRRIVLFFYVKYLHLHLKLKLYNTCIPSVFLYDCECWAVTKRDVFKIDALHQRCLWKLLGIKWYCHVWNDEVRRTTWQPHLTATVQAWCFSVLAHFVNVAYKVVYTVYTCFY